MGGDLRKLQLAELDLFKGFAKVCEKYGLTYFALGGTLLGAVRHQGFIPWDDDIDIGLPRPDYDRLCEVMKTEGKAEDFYFITFHDTEDHIRYFAHLENRKIPLVRHDNMKEEHTYAWIDIFPLDAMPNNRILQKLREFRVSFIRATHRFSCFDQLVNLNKKNRPLRERVLIWIGLHTPVQRMFHTQKRLLRLEKVLTKTEYDKSDYLVNAMGAYKFREMFEKKYYGDGVLYPFEDTKIRGPVDYDFVCRQLYGDYMTPPPEDERNHHGLEKIE